MNHPLDWIDSELKGLEDSGLFNRIRTIASPQGAHLSVDGVRVLNFCSNNYLGLANDPRLVQKAHALRDLPDLRWHLIGHLQRNKVKTVLDVVQVVHTVDRLALVTELVAAEAVPFLAAWRYTADGMRVRAEWERTWELQRAEDAGVDVGVIPVPPKYARTDFAKASYWPLRGKLDVPKERFISYPGIAKENDPTPLVGWAGWNHLDRAQALSGWYTESADAGRPEDELVSLLAGLWELAPWLRQWHNELDPAFGERLGDFFTTYTQTQATALGCTTDDLNAWRPPATIKKTRAKK